MTRIAITGAGGNVGRELLDAFDESEGQAFTHSEHDDIDSDRLDVTDPDDVTEKLDDFDVVIHLAGASSPDADWEAVSATNIQGTKHVLDAAVENDIDRVVFASSNHVVGPDASTLIHEVSTALAAGGDARTIAETIHVHPALSEVVQGAFQAAIDDVQSGI